MSHEVFNLRGYVGNGILHRFKTGVIDHRLKTLTGVVVLALKPIEFLPSLLLESCLKLASLIPSL